MENCRFPNKLKKFRRLFCLTQKEVARLLGLKDTSPISRWEKGISLPSLLHLFGLSRIYKTMPSEMYVDLWQSISKEISVKENSLLAQSESVISNQQFYI